jgi:hypothetical protein
LVGMCVGQNYPAANDTTLLYLAEKYGIATIPRLVWENGIVKTPPPGMVRREALARSGTGFHFDGIVSGRSGRRPLEIDDLIDD